jgi:hypothetical protein
MHPEVQTRKGDKPVDNERLASARHQYLPRDVLMYCAVNNTDLHDDREGDLFPVTLCCM